MPSENQPVATWKEYPEPVFPSPDEREIYCTPREILDFYFRPKRGGASAG